MGTGPAPGAGMGGAPVPGSGASSSFGNAPAPGTGLPGATPGTGSGILNPGAGSTTGPGSPTPGTGHLPDATPDAEGAASAFGEGAAKPPESNEPTFTIPGSYGRPSQQFTPGEGRLARPKFRFTSSVSFGYDDNVFQTPTDSAKGIPSQTFEVITDVGTPAQEVVGIGPNGEPMVVVVPGRAPTTGKIVVPGVRGQPRVGSFLNRANIGFDMQFASRRQLFTFDFNSGGNFFWDRPGKDVDYTGSLALVYLRRITPRLQILTNLNAIYQTQPDLSLINTSTQQSGSYFTGSARAELSYRFTPRISASVNMGYSMFGYQEEAQKGQNYGEFSIGSEVRYLYNPRFTLIGQFRYAQIDYPNSTAQNASSVFGLLGGELTLSRRFTATLMAGASLRTFEESGESNTAPTVELTLAYQIAKATLMQFDARFGFEAPGSADSELLSLRTSLNLVQTFSPRFRGTVGVTYIHQETSYNDIDFSSTSETINLGLGAVYNLTRQWTLTANYNYTSGFGSISSNDYFRNQAFIGAEYDF
jgi:opacity protein-like surface antigen